MYLLFTGFGNGNSKLGGAGFDFMDLACLGFSLFLGQ